MAWKLLFHKVLKPKDINKGKLLSYCHNDIIEFCESIPSQELRDWFLRKNNLDARVQLEGGVVDAQLEAFSGTSYTVEPSSCNLILHWSEVVAVGHFESHTDVSVHYRWEGDELQLKIEQPSPSYQLNLEEPANAWIFLAEKVLTATDVQRQLLRVPQMDITEFLESLPNEREKLKMRNNEVFRVQIYIGNDCFLGQLKTVHSPFHDDQWTAIDINTGNANGNPLVIGTKINLFYRWVAGMLEVALIPADQYADLPN